MILWGPPGVGKTTLARIIAGMTKSTFVPFSAVLAGIKEIKEIMAAAEKTRRMGHRTIVFVDEIHRFNKAQQDAFLPHVEHGNITLIGATTENPSFEVISALLSRTRVFVLKALSDEDVMVLLRRAVATRTIQRRRRIDPCDRGAGEWRCPDGTQYSGPCSARHSAGAANHQSRYRRSVAKDLPLRQDRRGTLQHHLSPS